MKQFCLCFVLLLFFLCSAGASVPEIRKETVSGTILNRETGAPLTAFVMEAGAENSCLSDKQGRFSLRIRDSSSLSDHVLLYVYKVGFLRKEVAVKPGDKIIILLEPEAVIHHMVQVTADSGVGSEEGKKVVTLKKMEIYSIPGASADPVYAAQVLPGVTALPDSSSILIRGGAPEEVHYQFEGTEVEHPFLSETLHESYFSIFDNQYVEKFNVSTSGFHPRFGDALSGVVDIEARDQFEKREGGVGLSVMGLNSFASWPFKNGGGVLFSLNKGYSRLLTEINGREGNSFQTENLFGKLKLKAGEKVQLRLFALRDLYSFSGADEFELKSRNHLFGITLQSTLSDKAVLNFTISRSLYDSRFSSMYYSEKQEDSVVQFRLDGMLQSGRHCLESGLDVQDRDRKIDAQITGMENVFGIRYSFFLNDRVELGRRIFANIGFRLHSLTLGRSSLYIDPRIAFAWMITQDHLLRFSAGIYQQYADYFVLNRAPSLLPSRAVHYSLSYDGAKAEWKWRITAYRKEYSHLPSWPEKTEIANDGYGYAQGLECYFNRESEKWKGIFVYNFLDSQRREGDLVEAARSPWEVSHSFTAILMFKWKRVNLGVRYSLASGLPYTPLAGRTWNEEDLMYEPVWDSPYSGRLPSFQRLDLNGNFMIPLKRNHMVLYFGVTNVLNRGNVLRYIYSEDYSSREEINSIFGRTLFLGIYLPLF